MKQPLAEGKMDTYGSITKDDDKSDTQDVIDHRLAEYGGPLALLVAGWLTILPVLGPLYVISWHNYATGKMGLRCQRFDNFTPTRIACDVTFAGALSFAPLSRVVAIALLTWRLIRHRFFYVLLRHKIFVVNFADSGLFAKIGLRALVMTFVLACCHLCMFVKLGRRDALPGEPIIPGLGGVGYNNLLEVPFMDVIRDPTVLLEQRHQQLLVWIFGSTFTFLAPGIIAVCSAMELDNTEISLIPLTKWYERCPHSAHQHLGDSVSVSEGVARLVLTNPVLGTDNESDADEETNTNHKKDLSEACESFRKSALSLDAMPEKVCSDVDMDMELAVASGKKAVSSEPLTLWDIYAQDGYAQRTLRFILKSSAQEEGPLDFRQVWQIHCALVITVLGLEFILRLAYTMRTAHLFFEAPTEADRGGPSTMVLMMMFTIPILLCSLVGVWILSRSLRFTRQEV